MTPADPAYQEACADKLTIIGGYADLGRLQAPHAPATCRRYFTAIAEAATGLHALLQAAPPPPPSRPLAWACVALGLGLLAWGHAARRRASGPDAPG
jgi:hypothetical protein